MEQGQTNKKYTAPRAGRKAKKKLFKVKEQNIKDNNPIVPTHAKEHNSKAFVMGNDATLKLKKQLTSHEMKLHRKIDNRVYGEYPPKCVVVTGPPKCGKTTIIKALVKHWTKQDLQDVTGPITVRSGRSKTTLIECPNNVNAMCDLAKVADLVLLVIDAKFGFEMETFEFVNILQIHGFTRVIGVLTHLDTFMENKQTRRLKKRMKQRFWTDVCEGAKLFYFSGIRRDTYLPREVMNLGRMVSVVKPRPIVWRSAHSCLLVDRYEDITNPEKIRENKLIPRTVCLYGYVRGTFLKPEQKIHIAGVGDFETKTVTSLDDPLPESEKDTKRKSLSRKFRSIYSPMSNVGSIIYDKDSVYIDVTDSREGYAIEKDKEFDSRDKVQKEYLLNSIQEKSQLIDEKLNNETFELLKTNQTHIVYNEAEDLPQLENSKEKNRKDGRRVAEFNKSSSSSNNVEYDDDDNDDSQYRNKRGSSSGNRDEEDDDEIFVPEGITSSKTKAGKSEEDNTTGDKSEKWKDKIGDSIPINNSDSLQILVYGNLTDRGISERKKLENIYNSGFNDYADVDDIDTTKEILELEDLNERWNKDEDFSQIRDKFVTGNWNKKKENEENEEDEEIDSEEDLSDEDNEDEEENDEEDNEEDENDPHFLKGIIDENDKDNLVMNKELMKIDKERKKLLFDTNYDVASGDEEEEDNEDNKYLSIAHLVKAQKKEDPQTILNKTEFEGMKKEEREKIEGFAPGTYIRIELSNVPCELTENIKFENPIIAGALKPEECKMGFMQVRMKTHRYYHKTLKNKDPLILSIGWRRYQTIPYYCVEDPNGRRRAIKYSPDYMHCIASIYGPVVPQNTGVVAFQTISDKVDFFRVAATGYTMEVDHQFTIVKKLKLIGYPKKIFQKSAIISQMFNSEMELAKFIGAKLRTVSGIRGQVKKEVKQGTVKCDVKPGDFRATFEDQILKSEVVYLRTWYPIEMVKFYNPVTNHLRSRWFAMRTVGELRQLRGLSIPVNKDSQYKEIKKRSTVGHNYTLRVKDKIMSQLPYSQQQKVFVDNDGISKSFNDLLYTKSDVNNLTQALLSKEETEEINFVKKMESIDAKRRIKGMKKLAKMKLKVLKKQVKTERNVKSLEAKKRKKMYVQDEIRKIKKAKYTMEE